ncbi:hypothetical protein [Klebsiella pasteurii]|uniref:hypothetical protein n=1 Tax=Klebsiella pasteurii TaxID=2587529 RepID=UPI0035CF3AD1
MLTHKTDEELIDTATKLAGYSEAGAVLRELVKRWQVQCELSEQQHLQMITLAAESEVIRQRQQGQPLVLPTLDNVVNQLKAVALVELSADLHTAIQTSPRIASIIPMDVLAFTHCADSTIARAIAKLLYLPIGPVDVERNEDGYWTHPAAALQPDWDEGTASTEIQEWYRAQGLEVEIVNLEDQDYDLQDQILEGTATLREWDPLPPDGGGWFLFCIFDTENGAHAEFARRLTA